MTCLESIKLLRNGQKASAHKLVGEEKGVKSERNTSKYTVIDVCQQVVAQQQEGSAMLAPHSTHKQGGCTTKAT